MISCLLQSTAKKLTKTRGQIMTQCTQISYTQTLQNATSCIKRREDQGEKKCLGKG